MAELSLTEQEPPSLVVNKDINPSESDGSLIKVTIDDEDEDESAGQVDTSAVENSNFVETAPKSNQHDHNYGNCPVPLNSANSYFGHNGDPFPLLEGLGDYVDNQSKLPLHQKTASPDLHNQQARAIRTSVGTGLSPINYADPKTREEMLKRRSVGNLLSRPREDIFVMSGRTFDNNRMVEQKKLQPATLVNKFPLRSAIKPTGLQQSVALSRQFNSPNSSGDQLNQSIAFYQQRQSHRVQQPIILKATPRILQPVPSAYGRRQPVQRQNVHPRKQVTEEETAILDVVNEEELRNQKFFQKQIGNQQQQQLQHSIQNLQTQSQQPQRQVTTSISTVPIPDEGTDPHGYFHKFQTVRHQPTNLIQSPPRQDFGRQLYPSSKTYYQTPQQQQSQQFGRISQSGTGQSSQFVATDQQAFSAVQTNSFQSQSPIRPRIRKPLIETTESPQRVSKIFTSSIKEPKPVSRGRKKKDLDTVEKKATKRKANASYNENDLYGDVEGVDYVTRCICDMKNNDPNMICCDVCNVWQHMVCMGIVPGAKNKNVEYKCEQCQPRPLKYTREQAARIQRAYLESLKDKSRGRKSGGGKTAKSTKELKFNIEKDKAGQQRLSMSAMNASKPESKFIETKITRGIRKILDKLSFGDSGLISKLGEPQVQTLVVAPNVYGVVSKGDILSGEPIFEYKASMGLRDERGSQSLSSKFFGNLILVVPGKSDEGGELVFADASRHSDIFSAKVRKSCQPNAEIRHVVTKDRDNENILRLFVVAREPIENCTEITIPLDLEYRGNEISELDCACRTSNYPNQAGSFSIGCPVAKYIEKKQNEVQEPELSPFHRKSHFSSPPKQQPDRRRTVSTQQQAVPLTPLVNNISEQEPKPEVSPLSTKAPTPLPMELEIANILLQDLPRSNSNAGTAKSLTSSPTRHSPVKVAPISSKKSPEKPLKKSLNKVKKESPGESNKSLKRSEGMSREIASLFDDNKFMSSSFEGDETASGRSLRQRTQVKKEESEAPAKSAASTSTRTPQAPLVRKRVHSRTITPASTSKSLSHRRDQTAEKEALAESTITTVRQFEKTLGRASSFTVSRKIYTLAKKSKRGITT